MTRFSPAWIATLLALTSCDGGSSLHAWVEPNRLVIETGPHEVPAGEELMECFYTDLIMDREIAVSTETLGFQDEGGHHLAAFWTLVHDAPGHHRCRDDEMVNWHQIGGADGSGMPAPEFVVDGLAARIPAGAQVVIQAHYVPNGENRTVRNRFEVRIPDPSEIREYAGNFVANDDLFELPARSGTRLVSLCRVDSEINIAYFLGHEHEWGTRFVFERRAAGTTDYEMIYDEAWEPSYASHPPVNNYGLDAPLVLHAGDEIRMTCEWQNNEDHAITFPSEMCIGFGLYFPDRGSDVDCTVYDRTETPM